MIAIKNILITLCVVVLSSLAMAQDVPNLVPSKLKSFGKNSLEMGDTYSAIDYFEKYMDKRPKDDEVAFMLGDCYRLARNYKEAEDWYKKAYDLNPKKEAEALYYYADMLKTEQQYDEALKYFTKFKKEYTGNDDRRLKKMLKDQMESCTKAKHIIDSSIVVGITPLDKNFNKASVEFSPYFLDDNNFIFGSLRTDTALYVSTTDPDPKLPVRKFYKGTKKGQTFKYVGEWKEGAFNAAGINTGNGALSPDKKRFYFTRCEKNWKYEVICKIYKSEKSGTSWKEPEALPESINDPKYTSTQPAVGIDSKSQNEVLYYVSNRKDGKGGLDIWYVLYNQKKKTWKEPKNCGGEINTAGDEMTPFVDNENKKLYFSSNGLPGIGGLDIFRAIGEDNKYLPAENVGYPINSTYDDLYYVLNSKKEEGFLVSNRPAKGSDKTGSEACCDDIYSFAYNQVIKVAATGSVFAITDDEVNKILSTGFEKVNTGKKSSKDTANSKAVAGSVVSLYLVDKLSGNNIYIKNDTTDVNGKYFFTLEPSKDYIMEFENYGNFNKKVKVTTKGIVKSDTIKVRPVGVNVMPKLPLIVKNIYYDFDRAELKAPAKRTLDTTVFTLMKQFPSIVIEISSHTDSKGDDAYNKKLSQKRAESVVNYLISRGIAANRLRAKGYGEEQPIAPNENPDGSDNEAGREKNRRTEFRIIGSLSQYSEIIYEQ